MHSPQMMYSRRPRQSLRQHTKQLVSELIAGTAAASDPVVQQPAQPLQYQQPTSPQTPARAAVSGNAAPSNSNIPPVQGTTAPSTYQQQQGTTGLQTPQVLSPASNAAAGTPATPAGATARALVLPPDTPAAVMPAAGACAPVPSQQAAVGNAEQSVSLAATETATATAAPLPTDSHAEAAAATEAPPPSTAVISQTVPGGDHQASVSTGPSMQQQPAESGGTSRAPPGSSTDKKGRIPLLEYVVDHLMAEYNKSAQNAPTREKVLEMLDVQYLVQFPHIYSWLSEKLLRRLKVSGAHWAWVRPRLGGVPVAS